MTDWRDKIIVGTSGYSYPDWVGPFYPRGTKQDEMLAVYAGSFSSVELNFTYYGIPKPTALERMVKQTPEGFTFFVKAYRGITHEDLVDGSIPPFLESLEPAREAGRLGGVLLQFPQSFHNDEENRAVFKRIVAALGGLPLVVEMRHDCWLKKNFYRYLEEHGVAYCCVDEPRLPGLLPPQSLATASIGYVRFHSRNGNHWYAGDARYDYDYSEEELREWLPRLQEIAARTTSVHVFFNNCHHAQAVENALAFQRLLGQETRLPAHPEQRDLFA